MRRLVSLLLSIGILSGAFIGCSTNNQKEVSDNENSSNISSKEKNNKEEVKNDNKDKKESKDSENDTKAKKEEKSSENEEVVTVKDGIITITKNLKMAKIMLNYNGGNPLEVNEIKDYREVENNEMLYGVIIGDNPLKLGSINGQWEYNTLVTKFDTIKYPNFFESKDKQMEFSLGSYMNNMGNDAKEEFENLIETFKKEGKVINKNQEGNTFSFTLEKDGFMEYHYGYISVKGDDVNTFIYKYPVKYKDVFNKIIEESKKSFVPTRLAIILINNKINYIKEVNSMNNNKKFKFIVYLDNKELVKQFFYTNIAPFTYYTLPVYGIPAGNVIFEIENRKIYLKAKINDFEKGEHIETLSEIGFEDLDDFSINKTKNKDVYHITMAKKKHKVGLNCSNGLNDDLAKEIVQYVRESA